MYLSDSYQQSYEPYPHSSESTALSSPQGWRVQDSGAVGYYPPTSYDAPNDFKHSCFSEETMTTARSSGHDVQGTSNASGMVSSYSLPPPESFNEVGSHNTISIDDFTPSNSPLNATAITNATYIEGVHWIAFSTQSSALVPYNYYTNTDTVAAGANTFEHQVSHNQSRSQSVLQNKRGHSCGLGCEDLLQDSEILQHMNQRHRDKKGGKVYCLDHKQAISWKNYARHIRTNHLKLKPFRCVMCQKPFGEKFNVMRHMEESCSARRRA